MSSGGWVGHTVSKAWHDVTGAVKKTVGAVTGGLFGGYRKYGGGSSQIIIPPSAAPAPTASEQSEYDAAVQNQKKKLKLRLHSRKITMQKTSKEKKLYSNAQFMRSKQKNCRKSMMNSQQKYLNSIH